MPQPINYAQGIPFARPTQGLAELGQLIGQRKDRAIVNEANQLKLNALKLADQQKEAQALKKIEFQKRIGSLNRNSPKEDIDAVYRDYPGFSDVIDKTATRFDLRNVNEAKTMFGRAEYALSKNNKTAASKIFHEYGKAFEEIDPEKADFYKQFANDILFDPVEESQSGLTMIGSRIIGDDYFKGKKAEADIAETVARTKDIPLDTAIESKKVDNALRRINLDENIQTMESNKVPNFSKKDEELFRDEQKSWSQTRAALIGINGLKKSFPKVWEGGFLNAKLVDVNSFLGTLDKNGVKKKSFMLELERIATEQGLAMRQEGSGSTSDTEFATFMDTVPKVEDDQRVIAKWLIGYQDRVKRRTGQSKIMLKWMDIHNGSRGSKGGIEIIPGFPKTKKGELPQEYMERIGSMGALAPSEKSLDEVPKSFIYTVGGKDYPFETQEQLDTFKSRVENR